MGALKGLGVVIGVALLLWMLFSIGCDSTYDAGTRGMYALMGVFVVGFLVVGMIVMANKHK